MGIGSVSALSRSWKKKKKKLLLQSIRIWFTRLVMMMILISTGVPRKTNTHCSDHSNSANLEPLTNQLSELSVAKAVVRQPSESDSSSLEDGKDVLERAGVEDVDLNNMQAGSDGKAPIQLISQVCKTSLHHLPGFNWDSWSGGKNN